MIQKQNIEISFAQGLDTKTDPWQVPAGKFLNLENSIFTKGGMLQKRNGFAQIASGLDSSVSSITTYNGNLTAIGDSIYAYNEESSSFINKCKFQPLSLNTLSLVKNSISQTQCDSVVAPNNAVCVVYTESNAGKYAVIDSKTSQVLAGPAALPTHSTYTVNGSPRVFLLGVNFIVVYTATTSGGANHLLYFVINSSTMATKTPVDYVSSYTASTNVAWDGVVLNNTLYLAWNLSGGAGIGMTTIPVTLDGTGSVVNIDNAHTATSVSVCVDTSLAWQAIYVTYWTSGAGYITGVTPALSNMWGSAKLWTSSASIANIASCATNGVCTIYYETSSNYTGTSTPSDYISYYQMLFVGRPGSNGVIARSVGLASKPFFIGSTQYILTSFQSPYQNSYFLMDNTGKIAARLAYENGGGYLTIGLPSVSVTDNVASVPYLFKDFISSINTGSTNVSQTPNIYFQTGVNLVNFTIGGVNVSTVETANTLNLSGGFLWAYDGSSAFENGFFVYPDSLTATWSNSGGSMAAQPDGATNTNAYFYQVTYEWSDNQGNVYRSTPSIPISVTTTSNGTSGSVALVIPTLRLSYKTNVKICVYRWSVKNQSYYQTTSLTSPTMNNPLVDSITFTDTNADATILGNNLIYTTGGVVEDTATASPSDLTQFDTRLWMIDGEDQNLLWYSKQNIEAVPVEMSDLFTYYISPTQAAQGPTGPCKAITPLDDKLIIWKKDAIYYVNGTGPDNTGSNNQYSQPTFITSTVGSDNPNSIVFIPQGLMFQSDKGIWILGRDLNTAFIGAPVEALTMNATVNSAANIPGTNQVRFTLSTGVTLMYDYFYEQWGTFVGVPAIAGTIYQGLHTVLSPYSTIQQETAGTYVDGANPVLMSFTTSWLKLMGLQGYQRAYFFYLIGTYLSPHKLQVQTSYDYNISAQQSNLISPNTYNFDGSYGSDPIYGGQSNYAGNGNLEKERIFLQKMRCQSFQISVSEIYDPNYGVAAGAGLTLSGLNVVIGAKKAYSPISSSRSVG